MSLLVVLAVSSVACMPLEPKEIAVEGVLRRETFAGRPNYESVAKGDEPETHLLLKLDEGSCVEGTPQKEFQLVFLSHAADQYKKLGPSVGKRVSCGGSLFEGHTGHHHTPFLLQVKSCSAF